MRHTATIKEVFVVLILTLGSCVASACSYQSFPRPVRSDFTVEVTYKSTPVEGLGIALKTVVDSESKAEPALVASGVTNSKGRLSFASLKPGDYSIEVVQPALPYSIWVQVGGHGKHEKPVKVLEFEWPGDALTAREAKGTVRVVRNTGNRVMDLARPQFQFAPGARVVLADLKSNKPLVSAVTDTQGKFVLTAPHPGLYVLHIERMADENFRDFVSDTPLNLDPAAKDLVLDLHLREICGRMVASNGYPN